MIGIGKDIQKGDIIQIPPGFDTVWLVLSINDEIEPLIRILEVTTDLTTSDDKEWDPKLRPRTLQRVQNDWAIIFR
jgi:serine/threonine protein kinase HipA of HipAB toxin-antitoxin module